MEEGKGRAWVPAMVCLMVEVFNKMRRDRYRDYELYSLSDETKTETKNIGLKVETETENETECL